MSRRYFNFELEIGVEASSRRDALRKIEALLEANGIEVNWEESEEDEISEEPAGAG